MGVVELLTLYAQPAQALRERHVGLGRHLWRGVLRVVGWVLVLASIGLAAWRIWQGWQTNEWYYAAEAIALIIVAYLLSVWLRGRSPLPTQAERAAIDILRAAVSDAQGAHVPLADSQPEMLASDELPVNPEAVKPPWLLGRIARSSPPVLGVLMLSAAPFLVDQLGVLPQGFPFDPFTFLSVIIPFTLFFLMLLSVRGGKPTITVDEIGIRWREGKREREHALDWARATAFFTASVTISNIPVTMYMLDSPDAILAWGIPLSGSLRPHFLEGEALARLVATRTRLPLRDATEWVEELGGLKPDLPALADEVGLAGVPPDLAPRPVSRIRRVGCLAQLAVLAALIVGGVGLRLYQNPFYFSSLPARLHAEMPIFADSLTTPTGAWPIQSPTGGDASSAQYVDGAYWLRGGANQTQQALISGAYSDMAVEVTARHLPDTGETSMQGVGLALRANAITAEAVYFWITPWGEADLWLYHPQGHDNFEEDWQQLAQQTNPAIHTGVGAWNRLLVVMRGGLYLCYANGTLVLTYYDQAHDVMGAPTPHTGQVGLFVNDGAVGGAFRDFAVYPIQSPPAFWYV